MRARSAWRTVDLWKHEAIPRKPGVYVFIRDGRVVYVGQSMDLHDRFYSYCARYNTLRSNHRPVGAWTFPERMHGVTVKISLSKRFGDWLMRELRLIRRLQPEENDNRYRLKELNIR